MATAYWSWAIQWGYLAIFLAVIGSFVAVVLALNGIAWLWRRKHDAAVMFGEQDDLYCDLEKLYAKKYDGKATFLHYSGTRIHKFVVMLFENGYDVRLFVENPKTAKKLECDYQQSRIVNAIAQFKRELPHCKKKGRTNGRIKIYQCDAPLSMRGALLDDSHVALGWYIYEATKLPPENFPNDKLAVWGHNGWGVVIDDRHSQFRPAREFLTEKCETWICATELWSYSP